MAKTCTKEGCSYPVFSSGYCRSHQYMKTTEPAREKKDRGLFIREPKIEKVKNDALESWFLEKQITIVYVYKQRCMECNAHIPTEFLRHAVAHILPKNSFTSIKTHYLNWLPLGAGCCHDKSHSIETFKKMRCFGEAVKRFIVFEPEIKETGHKYYLLFKQAAIESGHYTL